MHHHVFRDGSPPHNLDLFLSKKPTLWTLESNHLDDTVSDPQAIRWIDPASDLYNRTMRGTSNLKGREHGISQGSGIHTNTSFWVSSPQLSSEVSIFPNVQATASSEYTPFEVVFHKSAEIAVRSVHFVRSAP